MKGYLQRWLDDPEGGGCFARQSRLIREHNPDCPSLDHAWMPRRGGYSCLTDSMECEVCGITFFWDGLLTIHEDCPYSHHWVCRCCTLATCRCAIEEEQCQTLPTG